MNSLEKALKKRLEEGKKVLNLSSGNPNEFGIYYPRDKLSSALSHFSKAAIYSPVPAGLLSARKAICKYYSLQSFSIIPSQVLLTSGTSESYFHLFKYLSTGDKNFLLPNPTYPLFEELGRLAGADIRYYQLEEKLGWQPDLDLLEAKITPQTSAIIIVSPSNPTGAVLSSRTLDGIAAIAQKHNIAVISDEVFCEYIFGKNKFPRIAALHSGIDVFTLNGISKTLALLGLKLGWITVTGPHACSHYEALERSIDCFLSTGQIPQTILPRLLKDHTEFITVFRAHLKDNLEFITASLENNPRLSFHQPQGGFYLLLKIEKEHLKNPAITDEQLSLMLLKKHGLYVHPGYYYGIQRGCYLIISMLPRKAQFKKILRNMINTINTL